MEFLYETIELFEMEFGTDLNGVLLSHFNRVRLHHGVDGLGNRMGFFKPLILGKDQTGYNIKGEIWILVGGILSTAMRFVGHCVSSIVFFGLDVPGALIYNAAYVFISGGIALAVLMAMYGPLVKVNLYFNDRAIKRIN